VSNYFLNHYEEVTYDKLRIVCEAQGAHIFPKVRLADVFPINNSGLSDKDFRFSLQAHTDFLITNSKYEPQFCVEFDGPSHIQPEQIRRDNQKNFLFEHFKKPLLRINSKYLEPKYRGFDLLTYLVEVWFLKKDFLEAQECSQIPLDAIFDPALIIHDSKQKFPYWISLERQVSIEKLYEQGQVLQPASSEWVGIDLHGNYRCISWIFLTDNTAMYVKTGMRSQRFHAIVPSDLLVMIAVFELYEELQRVLAGEKEAFSVSDLEKELDFYRQSYELCLFCGCGAVEALDP